MMKKYFFFAGLLMSGLLIMPLAVNAGSKRRYIKRQHGVKLHWNMPSFQLMAGQSSSLAVTNLYAAYGYNWKGRVEVGPYVGLGAALQPSPGLQNYVAGLFVEYNFIKNRGRWKTIPALRLSLGADGSNGGTSGGTLDLRYAVELSPSVKFFVGKRTPLIVSAGYKALFVEGFSVQGLQHHIVGSAGFAYYFDFN